MSVKRSTLDSNILVYSVDLDAGEKRKQAIEIIDQSVGQECVLTIQALSEFVFVVTRKGKMPLKEALALVEDWQILFPIILPKVNSVNRAIKAVQQHHLSFWDAMIWAVAKENGVTRLISEDFQVGRELEGVLIVNPFVAV